MTVIPLENFLIKKGVNNFKNLDKNRIRKNIINIIDNPLVGIVFLIFATAIIYKKLTYPKNGQYRRFF